MAYNNTLYKNPGWKNNVAPTIGKKNMTDLSDHLEKLTVSDFSKISTIKTNLFDNPYFLNPINQKNDTGTFVSSGRIIDRWFGEQKDTTKYILTKYGVQINCGRAAAQGLGVVGQHLSPSSSARTRGRSITCSCVVLGYNGGLSMKIEFNDGSSTSSDEFEFNNPYDTSHPQAFSHTFIIPSNLTISTVYFIVSGSSSYPGLVANCALEYVKLEIGEIATSYISSIDEKTGKELVSISDGEPNYEVELKKCQSYFYIINGPCTVGTGGSIVSDSGGSARIYLSVPAKMVGIGQFHMSGSIYITQSYNGGNGWPVYQIRGNGVIGGNSASMLADTHTTVPSNGIDVFLWIPSGSSLWIESGI